MPISVMQKHVLSLLKGNRRPDSHVAGGIVINRDDSSTRFSADIDLFHDRPENVQRFAEEDASLLAESGFTIDWELREKSAFRVQARHSDEVIRLDWCVDSPFRFFQAQQDSVFGWCLHPADAATNKMLAIGGRAEIRDYIDALYLHDTYIHLGALLWAACGKDQGFTPDSLLYFARRHMKFREAELRRESLATPLSLVEIKSRWLAAAESAESLISRLPPAEIGCLYLDQSGTPVTPEPTNAEFRNLIRHYGSIGGSTPSIQNPIPSEPHS